MKIKELSVGSRRVNVEGIIAGLSETRMVNTKTGEQLKLVTAEFIDDTGQIKLNLWGVDADRFKVGDNVVIDNGYVTLYKGVLQLSTGKFGRITKA